MNTAYVYIWIHEPTGKWYIGSRTSKNAHPDDGYICSSKIVKPMIEANPDEWTREILFVGEPMQMRIKEAELLQEFNAKHQVLSFNLHNSDGNFKGTTGFQHTDDTKASISATQSGRKLSESTKKKLSDRRKGIKFSDEHRANLSKANKGKKKVVICPHCNKHGGEAIMKRFHFDRCKLLDITNPP